MKLNVSPKGLVYLFVLLFSTYSWALYPEKQVYSTSRDDLGVYFGIGIGTSSSNTFNLASKENYISLYAPTRTLSSAVSLANIGMRLYDFRFEGEYSNFYQWYSVFNDQRYHTSGINANTLPNKGQEVLTGFAFNSYYDLRFISTNFYPYVGFGFGSANARYVWVDRVLQPNGLGENFSGSKNLGFYQLMAGVQYDLKVVKSSFSIEYRFMKARAIKVSPGNDGLHDINEGMQPGNPESLFPDEKDWIKPVDKELSPVFHSVIFTLKYYLY